MQILEDVKEFQKLCLEWRAQGQRLALVPTMGAYHAGHQSLMAAAKASGARVLVSLFVNPAHSRPQAARSANSEINILILIGFLARKSKVRILSSQIYRSRPLYTKSAALR